MGKDPWALACWPSEHLLWHLHGGHSETALSLVTVTQTNALNLQTMLPRQVRGPEITQWVKGRSSYHLGPRGPVLLLPYIQSAHRTQKWQSLTEVVSLRCSPSFPLLPVADTLANTKAKSLAFTSGSKGNFAIESMVLTTGRVINEPL